MQKWSDIVLILILLPISLFSKISVSNYRQEGTKVRQIRGLRKSSEIKRPSLPKTHQTKNFTFHYTLTGPDSISKVDKDDNSIPDYIDSAATAAEYSYDLLLDSLGYSPPPLQNQRVDVYLYNLEYPTWGYPTQNEKVKTTSREYDYYSSMNIENDFQGEYGLGKYEAVKITIAHEFYHIVQLGYNYFESGELPGQKYGDTYFLEWSSTWFEDVAYPQVNHYDYQLFNEFFNSAQEPLWTYRYRYSLSTFLKYLSNDFGINLITKIWESIKKGNQAFYALKEVLLEETGKRLAWHWNKFFRVAYYSGDNYVPEKSICPDAKYFKELRIDSTSYQVFEGKQTIQSRTSPYSTNSFTISFDKSQYLGVDREKNYGDSLLTGYIIESEEQSDLESEFNLNRYSTLGKVSQQNKLIIFATNKTMENVEYSFVVSERPRPFVDSKISNLYPNPIDPSLKNHIAVEIKTDSRNNNLTLALFNILGQKVKGHKYILPQKSHGTRVYQFPISRSLASGVYIIRCQTGRDVDTRKITILK